jgi:hypothetical protein
MPDKKTHDPNRQTNDNDVSLVSEERLERIEADDVDVERDLATEEFFDTQHGEGHTYNPQQAQDQGLTYTPPTDSPVIPSEDDPQGVEIAAGFAPSMEESGPHAENLPLGVHGSDLDLQEDVYQTLRYHSETAHLDNIKVRVCNGVVILGGTVFSEDDIARVYDIVSDLEGVVEVRSHLRVED